MDFKFDREIMKWFDSFFEDKIDIFNVSNFLCSMQEFDSKKRTDNLIILEKENSNYWRLEFSIPKNYVIKLKKNVHPFFGEYIYDEISIYSDDKIYDFINMYIMKIMNNIVKYSYYPLEKVYYMDYNDDFISKCRYLQVGEKRVIDEDLYLIALSNKSFDFFNFAKTFKLNLSFEPSKGEDLLDSILDLRKSIIVNG
ncbi:MAG: hypothetical protein PEPC_00169 [Peptostreptococcus russellii]